MANYFLFQNVTAAQSLPTPASPLPSGNQIIDPITPSSPIPNVNQAFQLNVIGTSGVVSCVAQPIASNDGLNWTALGSPMAITASASPAVAMTTLSSTYNVFGAYVSSISGIGASATMIMSA